MGYADGKAAASARASVGGQVQRGPAKVEEDAQAQGTAPSLGTQSARTEHKDQWTRKPHRGLPVWKELIALMAMMAMIALTRSVACDQISMLLLSFTISPCTCEY